MVLRRLSTKKTPKEMEKSSFHLSSNQESNLPYKKFTKLANTPNKRRAKKPYPTCHPTPLNQEPNQQEWIKILAQIVKNANIHARKITTKYTQECVKKIISKYRQLYEKNPKKINKRVFKNQESSPFDCITYEHNNILTNPVDIANEIYKQQSISNRPTVPICYHQPEHTPYCTCEIRQYPWHDLDGFVIDKTENP